MNDKLHRERNNRAMRRTIYALAVTSRHITECFMRKIILQFSTDYSRFKISVQIVSLARSARLSHGKNVLQHASWA